MHQTQTSSLAWRQAPGHVLLRLQLSELGRRQASLQLLSLPHSRTSCSCTCRSLLRPEHHLDCCLLLLWRQACQCCLLLWRQLRHGCGIGSAPHDDRLLGASCHGGSLLLCLPLQQLHRHHLLLLLHGRQGCWRGASRDCRHGASARGNASPGHPALMLHGHCQELLQLCGVGHEGVEHLLLGLGQHIGLQNGQGQNGHNSKDCVRS